MSRTTLTRFCCLHAALCLGVFAGSAWAFNDADGDGLSDEVEVELGSDPNDASTDPDGWDDGREVLEEGTNVLLEDTDLDTVYDDADGDPFDPGSGDLDGTSTPNFLGYPTVKAYAFSGKSPLAGAGVALNSGVMVRSFRFGDSAGLSTATLRPSEAACCDTAPQPTVSTAETEFGLDIVMRSDSKFNGLTGLGTYSILDAKYTVDGAGNFKTFLGDGLRVTYVKTGSTYTTPTGLRDTLTLSGSVYTRTTPEGMQFVYEDNVLDKVRDRFGNETDLVHTSGKVTSIIDPRDRTHTLRYYTGTGRLKELETADGAIWTFRYNTQDELMRVEGPDADYPAGGVWLGFLYVNGDTSSDLHGNLSVEVDGRGNPAVRTVYDEYDRVVQQTLGVPDRLLQIDYTNASSQEVTVLDPEGNEKVWQWDATKLTRTSLTEKTNRGVRSGEGDYTTTWTHNSAGYLLTVTYPRGNGVKFTRNSVQLPTERRRKEDMAASDGSGDIVTTWSYDSGKYYGISSFTDPRGSTTGYTLNSMGQPTATALPDVTHFSPDQEIDLAATYNGDGTIASTTDGEGTVTSFDYYTTGAKTGLLWKTTVNSGSGNLNLVTELDYTDWGDVSSITDPRGNVTTRTVERYGNVTAVTSPSSLGYETQFQYNGNLLVTKIRRKNVDWDGTWLSSPQWWETLISYTTTVDEIASVVEKHTASAGRTTMFTYEKNGHVATRLLDGVLVEWTYDERGLLYQKVRDPGAIEAVETFAYDGNRNVSSYTNPRSKATTFTWDLFDRRTKATNALGHYVDLVYDKSDNLTERKSYEEAGATDVLLAHHKQSFDEINRMWKEEDLLQGTSDTWLTRTFTHDRRGLIVGCDKNDSGLIV